MRSPLQQPKCAIKVAQLVADFEDVCRLCASKGASALQPCQLCTSCVSKYPHLEEKDSHFQSITRAVFELFVLMDPEGT